MRFKLFFIFSCIVMFSSCEKKEGTKVNSIKISKSLKHGYKVKYQGLYILRFKKALKDIDKQYYVTKYGNKLSDERKDVLYPKALDLIYSTGITEEQLMKETQNDRSKIINKAFIIYNDQLSKK